MRGETATTGDGGGEGTEINSSPLVLDWGGGATRAGVGEDRGLTTATAAVPRLAIGHSMPLLTGRPHLRLVLIGPPASGKGTIARMLQKDFGPLQTLSTGVLLQNLAQQPGSEGQWMRDFLASGNLMADDQITDILFGALNRLSPGTGWLLDGYPRTVTQARILDERLEQRREFLSLAILLDIPREAIEERVMDRWVHVPSGRTYSASFNPPRHMGLDDETGEALSRRHDDNMVTFSKRFNNYLTHMSALTEYYKTMDKLLVVRGRDSSSLYAQVRGHLERELASDRRNEKEHEPESEQAQEPERSTLVQPARVAL